MKRIIATILMMLMSVGNAWCNIIYQDDFSGSSSTQLNGLLPDIGTNAWVAKTGWTADGIAATAANSSTTYLPFTPEEGMVYKFSVDLDMLYNGGNTNNFSAMGFIIGTDINNQITAQDAMCVYLRDYGLLSILGNQASKDTGIANLYTDENFATFSIVLDTTTALWTFKVERNGVEISGWHFNSNPSIVGVAMSKFGGTEVQFDNFTLETVPEPATLGLFAISGIIILIIRRVRN